MSHNDNNSLTHFSIFIYSSLLKIIKVPSSSPLFNSSSWWLEYFRVIITTVIIIIVNVIIFLIGCTQTNTSYYSNNAAESQLKFKKPPCWHSWCHSWHGGFCPFRRSFGCVLLLNQIFRKQCTVRQYSTLIYLINLLWKLVLGLGLDSELHYLSIFMENTKNEHLIFCECHGR